MPIDNANAIEWVLRIFQSMTFGVHGLLGVTEPFTSFLRDAFGDTHSAMPGWFWPTAGALLWAMAILNFFSNPAIVLGVQIYICAFHMGGFFYHQKLGHHFVMGCFPTVFAASAFCVVGVRIESFGLALIGWVACTALAFVLSNILVTPPPSLSETAEVSSTSNLLGAT